MSFSISGLGTALPQHTMSQAEATELATQVCCQNEEQARLLKVLYRRAGVSNRYTCVPHQVALDWIGRESEGGPRSVQSATALGPTTLERMQLYREHAYPLACEAAERALLDSPLTAAEITHLVTVSCTGFVAPGVDVELISRLGLPPTTLRTHVGFMGCHGAINGLRVVTAYATADPEARVLLCAVELCSLHYRFQWDPERFVGNVLFADGAAALVGAGSSSADDAWRVTSTGSCLIPDSTDAMTWCVGDHGFEMTLSSRVPDLIGEHLRPWMAAWLASQGLTIEQIGSWAVHPGGPRIVAAVEESLGLPKEATAVSREVLAQCGNMSSPTVLFILDRLRARQAPRPCVTIAFGPGLVAEAALLR
jgi:predicted naringenin-chalcone synthase